MPEISIVIPFHDTRVITVLDSLVCCASIERCETLVIGDGLTLSSLRFLEAYRDRMSMRVVSSDKVGRIGLLRNLGIGMATTSHLFFVDSDCVVGADVVTRLLGWLGRCRVLKGRNRFVGRTYLSGLDAQIRDERYSTNPRFAYCPNLLVHAEVFRVHGLFDPTLRYGSDGEFAKRIQEAQVVVEYDESIVVDHDCTDTCTGVISKWMNYGEARYLRYKGQRLTSPLSVYFPYLFSRRRGVAYNVAVAGCNLGRALGMLRGWIRTMGRGKSPQKS